MLKTIALGATLVASALAAVPAVAAPLGHAGVPAVAAADSMPVETVQWRRYGYGPGYYGPGPYYYRRGPSPGAAIGAGIAAGAIGALAAGAIASQARPVYPAPAPVYADPTPDEIAYCSRRFRSYDPETGTYIGSGGVVRSCP